LVCHVIITIVTQETVYNLVGFPSGTSLHQSRKSQWTMLFYQQECANPCLVMYSFVCTFNSLDKVSFYRNNYNLQDPTYSSIQWPPLVIMVSRGHIPCVWVRRVNTPIWLGRAWASPTLVVVDGRSTVTWPKIHE